MFVLLEYFDYFDCLVLAVLVVFMLLAARSFEISLLEIFEARTSESYESSLSSSELNSEEVDCCLFILRRFLPIDWGPFSYGAGLRFFLPLCFVFGVIKLTYLYMLVLWIIRILHLYCYSIKL